MTRTQRLTGGVLGALFIALHLPFLPPTLEDLDSINFALGIRQYDISQHQPHPPGYPLYIGAAKLLHAVGLSEVHALSLLGIIAGGLAFLALMWLFAQLDRDRGDGSHTWLAVLVVGTSPLFWFTAARPLSDVTGLAASIAVQAMLLSAGTAGALVPAAFLAAFAAGIRSQVVWLTLPVLVLAVLRLPAAERMRGAVRGVAAYAVGGLAWFIPLVLVSGGPSAYLKVFYSQGAEDLSGVAMLATTPTPRQAILAFQYHFLGPWGEWWIAAAVLVLAAAGFVVMAMRTRSALATLLVAYGPYLVFDLLFQETITTRYALPLVIPMGYLAVRGASLLPASLPAVLSLALVAGSAYVNDRAMAGFTSMDAPAFRLLEDMHVAATPEGAAVPTTPVLAMHRKEYYDFRRPIQWVGDRLPSFAQRLTTPPKHEWLEVVKYLNGGGREPIWFIADPLRSDLALFKYAKRPVTYRWPFSATILLGGARPNEMDWHVIDRPDWYLGEGWALTPETAGTAREDRKGPGYGPISGWVRRYPAPAVLMVGGRNLANAGPDATLTVSVAGRQLLAESIAPGFFLRMIPVPPIDAPGDYAEVTIASNSAELAIEQFDAAPAGQVVFGYGEGWNEQEYNPRTGVLWRWASGSSTLRVRPEGHGLALTLRGEIEHAKTSHVRIRVGDTVATEFDVSQAFSTVVMIPQSLLAAPEVNLTIESSHVYVPAEAEWRSQDRRKLGLKILELSLSPVS